MRDRAPDRIDAKQAVSQALHKSSEVFRRFLRTQAAHIRTVHTPRYTTAAAVGERAFVARRGLSLASLSSTNPALQEAKGQP